MWPVGVNKTLPDQPSPEIISGPGLSAREGTVNVHLENETDMPSNIQVLIESVYIVRYRWQMNPVSTIHTKRWQTAKKTFAFARCE